MIWQAFASEQQAVLLIARSQRPTSNFRTICCATRPHGVLFYETQGS